MRFVSRHRQRFSTLPRRPDWPNELPSIVLNYRRVPFLRHINWNATLTANLRLLPILSKVGAIIPFPRPSVWREVRFSMRTPSCVSSECESASLLLCVKRWCYCWTSVCSNSGGANLLLSSEQLQMGWIKELGALDMFRLLDFVLIITISL